MDGQTDGWVFRSAWLPSPHLFTFLSTPQITSIISSRGLCHTCISSFQDSSLTKISKYCLNNFTQICPFPLKISASKTTFNNCSWCRVYTLMTSLISLHGTTQSQQDRKNGVIWHHRVLRSATPKLCEFSYSLYEVSSFICLFTQLSLLLSQFRLWLPYHWL